MIKACPGDLKPSRFTQTPDELLKQDYSTINQLMIKILDRLLTLESTMDRPHSLLFHKS
jgi:hypothetical protein